ncbi:MAG: hypothetical protein J6W86_08085 [Bacteroidales bacterium]|nr:hypothetical protein [Bacteroidales bacterium]
MSVSNWIKTLPPRGRYTFTKEDLVAAFPGIKPHTLAIALSREVAKNIIFSPWRGFYVIIPDEYKLKGVAEQSFYINELMEYLKRPYYISLLSAASHYSAAHQKPMAFYVTIEPPIMRSKETDSYITYFIQRNSIPAKYVTRVAVPTGWLSYSSPELTAVDLIEYRHNVGGLDRASTVLAELVEQTDFSKLDAGFLATAPITTFQRLGYICEKVLGENKVANDVYSLIEKGNQVMRTTPLKSNAEYKSFPINKRWKIIENFQIEIDDL